MTPERLAEIRAHVERVYRQYPDHPIHELLAEVERLQGELASAFESFELLIGPESPFGANKVARGAIIGAFVGSFVERGP